tara:strand:+ start:41 stop:214 length:174 start_codon:yes stop_codon:yes gene_type:complete
MHKCKKCKDGVLEYDYDYIGCEVETYHCKNKDCDGVFHVDIEIVRDFNNMREVKESI